MRWMIPLLALTLLVACGGSSESGSGTDVQQDTVEQTLYDGFLREARSQLRDTGADIYCDLFYQDEVVQGANLGAGDEVILQFALLDACIEVGAFEANYSRYHANAP